MLLASLTGLILAPWPPAGWRSLVAVSIFVLAWPPLRAMVWVKGPYAVKNVEWSMDGAWHIGVGGGEPRVVELATGSAVLGPLVFLAWTGGGGRRHAVVDSACSNPQIFRTLCARLRHEATGRARRRNGHTC
jgi:hypothetical protein